MGNILSPDLPSGIHSVRVTSIYAHLKQNAADFRAGFYRFRNAREIFFCNSLPLVFSINNEIRKKWGSSMIEQIQNKDHFEELRTQYEDLFMVVFFTENSRKSLEAIETLNKIKDQNEDLGLFKLNAAEVKDVHPQYHVTTVPTLVTFRHGKPAEYVYGSQTEAYYNRLLQKFKVSTNGDGSGASHRVTVFTTPTCPYCDMVKRYLTSLNVPYSEVDVASDQAAAQELVSRTGQQGVPQTEIDGKFVVGYNTSEIDRLLNA